MRIILTKFNKSMIYNNNLDCLYGNGMLIGKPADKISEYDEIYKYSNPKKVQELAKDYLGEGVTIFRSTKKDKKYMVYDKFDNKWVHFGQMGYEDFTKHQDENRRQQYLARAINIKGNWKNNKYSANNLSLYTLWEYGKNTI